MATLFVMPSCFCRPAGSSCRARRTGGHARRGGQGSAFCPQNPGLYRTYYTVSDGGSPAATGKGGAALTFDSQGAAAFREPLCALNGVEWRANFRVERLGTLMAASRPPDDAAPGYWGSSAPTRRSPDGARRARSRCFRPFGFGGTAAAGIPRSRRSAPRTERPDPTSTSTDRRCSPKRKDCGSATDQQHVEGHVEIEALPSRRCRTPINVALCELGHR